VTGTSHSLNNLDIDSFSFRWDFGLDCEDEDGSVSDYGTVLHTGETNLSAPLTTTTGLSVVEEITEGVLTDSRSTYTSHRLSPSLPPGDNELGLLSPHDHKVLAVTRDCNSILGRLRSVGERAIPRFSIPWPVLAPTPPTVNVQVDSSEKPSAALHPRPKNKLRKKARPSIAITLAVEPASSFSLAQPFPRSLAALQASTNPVSAQPVAGFPSAKSFLSFQLPPVFSKARSKLLQKSTYRPSNDIVVVDSTSTTNHFSVDPSSGIRTRLSGGRVSRDTRQAHISERTGPTGDDGIGGFPTPAKPVVHHGRRAGSKEGPIAHRRSSQISTSWELGLGLGQDLRLRVCDLWRGRGGW